MMKDMLRFLNHITVAFTVTMVTIAFMGLLFKEEIFVISRFYVKDGISLSAVGQILALTMLVSLSNMILDKPTVLKKLRIWTRILLRMIIVLIIIVVFILLFQWFPVDNTMAWFSFFLCFGVCFITAVSLSLYLHKVRNKEYQQLLEEYKQKKHEAKGE